MTLGIFHWPWYKYNPGRFNVSLEVVQNMIKGPFWMNPEVLANLLLYWLFFYFLDPDWAPFIVNTWLLECVVKRKAKNILFLSQYAKAMLPLKYFTSCHWHRSPFHPKLSRIQQVPGPPSPLASHAWTAHQTSLSPSLSHPHYSPGIEAEIRGKIVLMCQMQTKLIFMLFQSLLHSPMMHTFPYHR